MMYPAHVGPEWWEYGGLRTYARLTALVEKRAEAFFGLARDQWSKSICDFVEKENAALRERLTISLDMRSRVCSGLKKSLDKALPVCYLGLMNKQAWLAHAKDVLYGVMDKAERAAHEADCLECKARLRTKRANRNARERHDALTSLGLRRTPYGYE